MEPVAATFTLSIPADAITLAAPLPELLSQRNVEATTGVPSSVFLCILRAPGFPLSVTRLGKLRLVDRAAFVAWLKSGAGTARLPTGPTNEHRATLEKRLGVTSRKPGR